MQVLEGDRLVTTPYDMKFREDRDNQVLCKKGLSREDVRAFRDAVKWDYYFQARVRWPLPPALSISCIPLHKYNA